MNHFELSNGLDAVVYEYLHCIGKPLVYYV